jgi:hypothetical protein
MLRLHTVDTAAVASSFKLASVFASAHFWIQSYYDHHDHHVSTAVFFAEESGNNDTAIRGL